MEFLGFDTYGIITLAVVALILGGGWLYFRIPRKKKPVVHQGVVYIDRMPWAGYLDSRCQARLKRGEDPEFFGRCNLVSDHYSDMPDDHHCLERGMVWVRWDEAKNIRYDTPHYDSR